MALVLQEKEEKKKAGKAGKIKEKGRSPVAGAGDPLWPPPRLLEHNLECPPLQPDRKPPPQAPTLTGKSNTRSCEMLLGQHIPSHCLDIPGCHWPTCTLPSVTHNIGKKSRPRVIAWETNCCLKIPRKESSQSVQQQHMAITLAIIHPSRAISGRGMTSNRLSSSLAITHDQAPWSQMPPSPKNGNKARPKISSAGTF